MRTVGFFIYLTTMSGFIRQRWLINSSRFSGDTMTDLRPHLISMRSSDAAGAERKVWVVRNDSILDIAKESVKIHKQLTVSLSSSMTYLMLNSGNRTAANTTRFITSATNEIPSASIGTAHNATTATHTATSHASTFDL